MLSLVKSNGVRVIKPTSKIIINNIKNIHSLSPKKPFLQVNYNIPALINKNFIQPEQTIPLNLNLNNLNLINKCNMSSSIPKVFPKDVIIDNKEKIELIKNKKVKMARPFHWEEMKYILDNNSVEIMVRNPADEIVYLNWMKVCKTKYGSINDFIKINVMGYSEIIDKKTGVKLADKPKYKTDNLIFESEDVYYVFRRNDFPYWLEPNIEHYVLWTSEEFTREHAGAIIKEKFPEYDTIYFSNTPEKKSVKGVCHYQIFIRPKSTPLNTIKLNEQKLKDLKSKNFNV